MTEYTFFKRYSYRLYLLTVLVVGIIAAGGATSMTSSVHNADALVNGLPHSDNNEKLLKIVKWQKAQYPNTFLERPRVELVSSLRNPIMPMSILNNSTIPTSVNSPDPVVQDLISRLNLTIIDSLSNGDVRLLTPEYQLTQVNQSGNPDYRIFNYIWKENHRHYELEAILAISPVEDEYYIEIAKFTPRTINVKVDGANLVNGTMPGTNITGEVVPGFLSFRIAR